MHTSLEDAYDSMLQFLKISSKKCHVSFFVSLCCNILDWSLRYECYNVTRWVKRKRKFVPLNAQLVQIVRAFK